MALPSLPTTFFNKASGKAINKTLDESCIPFPSPAALRRIRSSDSLVAASEFSVTTTWSVESSFHEVTRPDWAGETFVDQVTPDTQVEWQLSEECTRQLADTMHTPMPKGEELAPLHDAEPQRTSNPDESGSLRQSQAPFATRSTILTHPRLDRSKFYLTPPTEDSQEPESPVILRLRGGAGPASPENNDTDSCANIDELAEQWDPFHVKTDPKRGRFSKLFGKTSSTPKADKRPSKFGLGVRMPGISVVPALKLFSKGGNQAGSHGEDPPQGQTRSKHQRRNSANPAKIEFFFDQEEERKGPYMTRSSSAPSKLESLEDMHRLNASLQELSLRGGYLEGQSHEGSQPESECGSDFTAVDESEPFEYLQDSDPPLTLRGGGGDGNFHADEDEETWEVEEHQAPLPKVQPTARAQSAKEREQVSDFRDKVVRTAQPAYNPKTPEAQREASFLTSKDLMHIRDHILSSSTTQDRSTKQERDIQGFAGLAKPHILNEVGLTHMDIECSGQHNWPTTFDFANFATTLPSLKDANTASMSTNQGRRYRHEGLPISDPPVGDQVTGMHDDSTHSQSLQIPPSQQDDSETLNDDEGNMQAKHDWETQPDDAVELSDDDEDWSSKSSQGTFQVYSSLRVVSYFSFHGVH